MEIRGLGIVNITHLFGVGAIRDNKQIQLVAELEEWDASKDYDRIGDGKSIESLDELDGYEGNTFISGSGYFLNSDEARSLVARKDRIRYDVADDVAVGLMFAKHDLLPGFTLTLSPDTEIPEMIDRMRHSNACHVRLEHFPLECAETLWRELEGDELWK